MSIIVWEWQNEINIFLPYSSEICTQLEGARNNSVAEVMLGAIDPCLATFKVNISTMKQITTYNGRERLVRRIPINPNHPFARGTKWEWNFRGSHWFPYGTQVAEKIQEAVDRGVAGPFQIPTLIPNYQIDVGAMVQTNLTTGYQRQIRSVRCTPYQQPGSSYQPATTRPARPAPPSYLPAPPSYLPTLLSQPAQRPAIRPAPAAQRPAPRPQPAPRSQPAPRPQPATRSQPAAASQPAAGSSSAGSSRGGPPPLSPALQSIIRSSCTQYQPSSATPDICPVCQNNMTEASDYTTSPQLIGLQFDKITLKCGHHLHAQCLHALISASNNTTSFTCPECQRSFGTKSGNQPTNGKMAVKIDNSMSLAGYEQYGTIIVTYSFSSGVQDGVSYTAHGFPRIAYFPDNDQGNDIVDLIKVAFKRRLIFTIGDSVTSGMKNCLVWNDIHHKTSTVRGDAYGYPDPGYLDRVTAELKSKGVE